LIGGWIGRIGTAVVVVLFGRGTDSMCAHDESGKTGYPYFFKEKAIGPALYIN
jgi:hypothetical protein